MRKIGQVGPRAKSSASMKNWVDEIPDEQSDEERRDHCGRPPQFGFLKIHSPNQARPARPRPLSANRIVRKHEPKGGSAVIGTLRYFYCIGSRPSYNVLNVIYL